MGKARRKKQSVFQPTPQGYVPMSEALIDLVMPLYHDGLPLDAYRVLIDFAATAWNIAQLPKEQRKDQLLAFLKSAPELGLSFDEIIAAGSDDEVKAEPNTEMNVAELFKSLLHRKDSLFPQDPRIVVEWNVFWENGEYRVVAASKFPPAAQDE